MTFTDQARSAQIAWKQTSPLLPAEARAPGMYRGTERVFCLPPDYARLNLLPGAEGALDTFASVGIPWHDGVGGGPSNHLCSSQVQCVNALAPFALRPEALLDVFRSVLDIAAVLPLRDPVARDHYVGFEWIGDDDPLGEWNGLAGTRGAHNTSAAAMRYVTNEGVDLIGHLSNPDLAELCGPDGQAVEGVPVERPVRQVQRRLEPSAVHDLILAYQGGARVSDLAGRFQVHRGTVRRLLERHQVEPRVRGLDEARTAQAVRLYAAGRSLAAIGEHFGVHGATVWRALRAAGVERRPRPG